MEVLEKNTEQPAEPAENTTVRKKGRVWIAVLLILTSCALLAAAVLMELDGRHVRFYMTGDEAMILECGESYREPGVYAVSVGRLFGEGRKPLKIDTSGEVDSSVPGSYMLEYTVRYLGKDYRAVRLVHVVDTTGPEILLNYDDSYRLNWLDGYEEEGYSALDIGDGDLTDKVERQILSDRVLYTVTDSSGNLGYAVRMLDYSASKPEIRLNGGSILELRASAVYTDPGYVAYDAQGNDWTELVKVEGEVCPDETGDYLLTYSIVNALGEAVSVTRRVTVFPAAQGRELDPNKNTIYLTFDDGPGPYTAELLDILAEYNVKATFFVTGLNSDYSDMIGRAYREGHSIGVHSASHNYYRIYESEAAYMADFNKVEELIYQQTGEYTKLFRFPGGSSNTVSSFNKGIMTRLAASMVNQGYQYYDWNVDSDDAGSTTDTQKIVQNIIDGCEGRRASIVLQHDIKDYSVAAVEDVLLWGLKNGYQFSALDLSSPTSHHGIAN